MIAVPASERIDTLTDWIEATCLFGSSGITSKSDVQTALDQAEVSKPEETVENIWGNLAARSVRLGASYPLEIESTRITRKTTWKNSCAYAFQLLVATQTHYPLKRVAKKTWNTLSKQFEILTTYAVAESICRSGINIGFPRDPKRVPKGFGECLDFVCKQIYEPRGTIEKFSKSTKDEGVDAIAWIPFNDKRPGKVSLLVQCAAGKDWETKLGDLEVDVWKDYIDFHTKPMKAFAFPFVCSDMLTWRRLARKGGIPLDRLRITHLFDSTSGHSKFVTELRRSCKPLIHQLPQI